MVNNIILAFKFYLTARPFHSKMYITASINLSIDTYIYIYTQNT